MRKYRDEAIRTARIKAAQAAIPLERKQEIRSHGGTASGTLHKQNRTGIFGSARTKETESLGGRVSCHIRWHVRRGRVNPLCSLCVGQEFSKTAYAEEQ